MSTTIEETCCDECGTELEPNQVGLCDDCDDRRARPFSELCERAKDKARSDYTAGDYPGYDWWDRIYEDAVRMAKMLGIEIDTREFKTMGRKTSHEPKIFFSGFCSQGDGASFEGSYSLNPDCVKEISAETNDKELIRIASELYTLQLARRIQGLEPFSATISTSGNCSHSGAMNIGLADWDDDSEENYNAQAELEGEITQLMRDFADWIYERLEAENDWYYSDEYVDERLIEDDMVFNADGDLQS